MTTQETSLSDDFAAGFDDADTPAIERVDNAAPAVIEQPIEAPEAAEESAVAAPPETVSLTKDEWESTRAQLNELAEFRKQAAKQIDGIAGKYGEVNRTLMNLPKSGSFNPDALARIKSEFPELGEMLEQLGTVPASNVPAISQEEIDRRISETVAQREERLRTELRHEQLADAHGDWQQVVASNEFEQWRLSQPAAYAEELLKSKSVRVVSEAITKFKASKESPAKPAPAPKSKARLEAAITPQGSPSRGAPTKSESDYFKEGFGS